MIIPPGFRFLKMVESIKTSLSLQPLDSVGSSPALSPPQEKPSNKERLVASGSCWTLAGDEKAGSSGTGIGSPSSLSASSSSPPRVAWIEEGREDSYRVKVIYPSS